MFEVKITTADSERVACEDHMGVLPFEGEEFEGSAGVLRSVSERNALKRRSGFLKELVESGGVGVAVYTANGRLEYVNDAYASLLGYDAADLLGTSVFEVN